jgi:hypothetical protein
MLTGDGWVADSARTASSYRRVPSGEPQPKPLVAPSRTHADGGTKLINKPGDTRAGPRTRQRATEFDQREGRAIAPEQKPGTKRGTMAARNWSMPGQKEDGMALKERRPISGNTMHSHSFTEGSGEQRIRHSPARSRDLVLPRIGHVDTGRRATAGDRIYHGPRDASDTRRSRKKSAVRGSSSRPDDQKPYRTRQSHHQNPQSRHKTPTPESNPAGIVRTLRRFLHL